MRSIKINHYCRGLRAGVPVIFGFIPTGIAYAIMARQAGFTVAQTCLMSLSVFAGASQMMAAGMVAQGASVIAIILATFILNLRHIIMSVCVFRRMRADRIVIKLLAAFGVTDESFAIFTTESEQNCSVWFFLGMITVTYSSWNLGSLIGAVALELLPAAVTASFGIALYAMFIAIIMPGLRVNFKLVALVLLTAVCNTVFNAFLDSSWSIVISMLVCAFIGVFFVELEEEETDEQH